MRLALHLENALRFLVRGHSLNVRSWRYLKESYYVGFSACGGAHKRLLPFRRSAIRAEHFFMATQFPIKKQGLASKLAVRSLWRLSILFAEQIRSYAAHRG